MQARPALPRTVVALGGVSFLMDTSSEMIHALLPLFLVGVIGVSPVILGLIEGLSEALALMAKVFSGVLSDRMPRRKPLIVAGYGLAAITKPWFAMSDSVAGVTGARLADRFGKGVRGAPRDALIADVTSRHQRGAAFGLRQALDTAGALVGPLIAVALLTWVTTDLRTVFWFATIPAALAVIVLVVAVSEAPVARHGGWPWRRHGGGLGPAFWSVALIGTVLQLARFSEAFVILRAGQLAWPLASIPLVLVAISLSYALTAYPAGALSDRYGRTRLLLPGIAALIAADAVLALFPNVPGVLAGALLWGMHLGLTAGVLAAMITDAAPETLRGTAFGVFNLLSGAALLIASLLAGALWQWAGPQATFVGGAVLAGLAWLVAASLLATGRA